MLTLKLQSLHLSFPLLPSQVFKRLLYFTLPLPPLSLSLSLFLLPFTSLLQSAPSQTNFPHYICTLSYQTYLQGELIWYIFSFSIQFKSRTTKGSLKETPKPTQLPILVWSPELIEKKTQRNLDRKDGYIFHRCRKGRANLLTW